MQPEGLESWWVAGEAKPPLQEQRLLRDTFQVVELLAEVDPDEVVRAWFIGMNQAGPSDPVSTAKSTLSVLVGRWPTSVRYRRR